MAAKHSKRAEPMEAVPVQRLHPCPGCGHTTMDACWAASNEIPVRSRKLCLDCHDECLSKVRRRTGTAAPRPHHPAAPEEVPRLLFLPFAGRV